MDFLSRILSSRRERVEESKARVPWPDLEREAESRDTPRNFRAALAEPGMSLIAEFKRASPSRGPLAEGLDPAVQARAYEHGGARALSVLIEPEFFRGSPDDLTAARRATKLPVLWKDFVIDPYQVTLARSYDADAVLVIVRILTDEVLAGIMDAIKRWGMTALVEVFNESDLERALRAGADVVGVNHRDLETFEEDTEATARLRPLIPPGVLSVAESAIKTRDDVKELEVIGVDAILVGEALVRASAPAQKVSELLGSLDGRPERGPR